MAKTRKDKSVREGPVEKKLSQVKKATKIVGMKKKYLQNRHVCKVTFRLPKVVTLDAKSVCVVGDFNNWSIHANQMKK
jgi:hypothetical protein